MSNESKKLSEIVQEMDGFVLAVISSKEPEGLERGYQIAEAYQKLEELLTPEVMAPIMYLQGKKLGFCTDKDTNADGTIGTGYDLEVVKRAVIDAVLMGLQVYGNHFNILGGRMYPTKEGIIYLLDKKKFIAYLITPQPPKVIGQTAFVDVVINWSEFGEGKKQEYKLPIAIHVGRGASYDSIAGKAYRKGAAWLLNKITGLKIADGEVADTKPVKEGAVEKKKTIKERRASGEIKKREKML